MNYYGFFYIQYYTIQTVFLTKLMISVYNILNDESWTECLGVGVKQCISETFKLGIRSVVIIWDTGNYVPGMGTIWDTGEYTPWQSLETLLNIFLGNY